MNRDPYRRRAEELRERAEQLLQLSKLPDRATVDDFRLASALMTKAATDLDDLLKASPIGCICPRVETDKHSYLDYVESCPHHHDLHRTRAHVKAEYAKMERALKNEARLRLIAAVLSASSASGNAAAVVKRAIEIADAAIDQITRETQS